MKKILAISLITLAVLTSAAYTVFGVKRAVAAPAPEDPRRAALVAALGPDLVVPQMLPASIDDPNVLEAWVRLYNHEDAIQLWDGRGLRRSTEGSVKRLEGLDARMVACTRGFLGDVRALR